MEDWFFFNTLIQECIGTNDPIACLIQLFEKTGDAMVALRLGDQYVKKGDLETAATYYREAQVRFPRRFWKLTAKKKLETVKILSTNIRKKESILFIVSCTEKKIWKNDQNAPEYVPAELAYTGSTITNWLDDIRSIKSSWLILSAKYGFLEPNHPINNYDVTFSDNKTGPISDESLKNQVLYQERLGIKLVTFEKVIVKGSEAYYEKVKLAFSETGVIVERE